VKGNQPELELASVRCSTCGTEFTTRSTRAEIVVDVCSSCHPVYTGVERTVARGNRIDRFERRRARSRQASHPV
jgi:large subunit ribosomal protein L31